MKTIARLHTPTTVKMNREDNKQFERMLMRDTVLVIATGIVIAVLLVMAGFYLLDFVL